MNAEIMASRNMLKEVNARVKQHFPRVDVLQGCFTEKTSSVGYKFTANVGPTKYDKFYWTGSAKNAYDCRAKGWEAYLKFKGVE